MNKLIIGSLFSGSGLALIALGLQAKRSGEVLLLRIALGLLFLDSMLIIFIPHFPGLLMIIVLMAASTQKGIKAGAIKKQQIQKIEDNGPIDVGV